jgi:copper homeostasis protein
VHLLLEVIAQSVEDARAAAAGGADRLEIVREISRGGLTPQIELVRAIAAEVPLPLRVMVRENDGYGVSGARELSVLQRTMEQRGELRVDGAVAGFASNGRADLATLQAVMGAAPGLRVTFHRAFDTVTDPAEAIRSLREVPGVDRILTDGGSGDVHARCRQLLEYSKHAAGRLIILAGGGVGEREISAIRASGAVREVHVGRAARAHDDANGPVSTERVRRLRDIADGRIQPR